MRRGMHSGTTKMLLRSTSMETLRRVSSASVSYSQNQNHEYTGADYAQETYNECLIFEHDTYFFQLTYLR